MASVFASCRGHSTDSFQRVGGRRCYYILFLGSQFPTRNVTHQLRTNCALLHFCFPRSIMLTHCTCSDITSHSQTLSDLLSHSCCLLLYVQALTLVQAVQHGSIWSGQCFKCKHLSPVVGSCLCNILPLRQHRLLPSGCMCMFLIPYAVSFCVSSP